MKRLFLILSSLLICCGIYADDATWFSPYRAAFSVNLGEPSAFPGASGMTHGQDYDDNHMVGNLGINEIDPNAEYTIECTFLDTAASGQDWTYVSLSNRNYSVPFGLDLVIRYRRETHGLFDGLTGWATYSYSVLKMGYQEDTSSGSGRTMNSVSFKPSEHMTGGENDFVSIFMDIVLELPETARTNFLIGNAEDYQASFQIVVKKNGVDIGSYPVMLTGYIGNTGSHSNDNVLFTLTPHANAYAININDLYGGLEIEIGKYFFTTEYTREGGNKYDRDKPAYSPYHIFASSSRDPNNTNANLFSMRHEDISSAATINNRNGFYYEIGLSSKSGQVKWFDGTDDYTSLLDSQIRFEQMSHAGEWGRYDLDPSWFDEDYTYSYYIDDGHTLSYFDEGTILIQMNEKENNRIGFSTETLSEGVYKSTVYIHLISDL